MPIKSAQMDCGGGPSIPPSSKRSLLPVPILPAPTLALRLHQAFLPKSNPRGVSGATLLLLLACLCLPAYASKDSWVWRGGSNSIAHPGVYGRLGVPAANNIPGSRSDASSWTDSKGHLWLFGGQGLDSNGNSGSLNDLWEFDPQRGEWTWVGGSNTVAAQGQYLYGVYGTKGQPAAGNFPGGRVDAVSWTDSRGHLWLFGGSGGGGNDYVGGQYLNDLWEFNPDTREWTWMAGTQESGEPGVYGTQGSPAPFNSPGGRNSAVGWTDSKGNLFLFGGSGLDSQGNQGDLNDLWKFDRASSQWTWLAGDNTYYCIYFYYTPYCWAAAAYGTQGTPAMGNTPGGRYSMTSWTDSKGNFWLFGGFGVVSGTPDGFLNDVWRYSPSSNEWAWMGGANLN